LFVVVHDLIKNSEVSREELVIVTKAGYIQGYVVENGDAFSFAPLLGRTWMQRLNERKMVHHFQKLPSFRRDFGTA
jgi:hypothetical protein